MVAEVLDEHWCSVCGDATEHVAVPCEDGHGADCPEVLCARCGAVVVVAVVLEGGTGRGGAAGAA